MRAQTHRYDLSCGIQRRVTTSSRVVQLLSGRQVALFEVLPIILAQRGLVSQDRRPVAARRVLADRIGQPSIDTMAATIVTSAITAHTALKK